MNASIVARDADLEVSTIYEISKILSSSLDLEKTVREVLKVLTVQLGIQRGMVSMGHESGELHMIGAVGLSKEELERGVYQPGEGITGRILVTGSPSVVPNIANEPMFLNRTGALQAVPEGRTGAFIGVP